MKVKRSTLLLTLGGLSLATVGCRAPVRQPAVRDTQPATPPEVRQDDEHHERIGAKRESFANRAAFVLAYTTEEGDDDITFGLEYERHVTEYWGVGGLVDFFTGEVDEALVAVSFIYHPIHPVGLVAAPGYQFVDGEDDRLALRLGMTYEFELDERFSIAPVIYTDFIEGGLRSAVIGVALNYNF